MVIMLSGAAIVYKKKNQKKTVALSSNEAEFVSCLDAGKMILYIGHTFKTLDLIKHNLHNCTWIILGVPSS